MLKNILICLSILLLVTPAFAVPVLQVGAPAGPGDVGTYADYQPSLTNPTETWTAITSGSTLYLAGVYGPNVSNLGGKFEGGKDWSQVKWMGNEYFPQVFDAHGAILIASVPEGSLGSLFVDGILPFYSNPTTSYFPNLHDPVKDGIADFLFFDVGNFAKIPGAVPDFDLETGAADGEIKTVTISGSGYEWVHFDLIALETIKKENNNRPPTYDTNRAFSPPSHDVTMVPEPATMFLLGSGLIGIGAFVRRRFRK